MAAQSALDLSTPLNRLNTLPTAVNWRGGWSPTEVYYRNDIAVSPITSGSYVNISPSTTILDGGDPSINMTAWAIFGQGAAGVQEIQGSEYITVGPTSTPQISNNGVCELAIGQNLNNLGTQQDPILEDLGIISLLPNPGISVVGNTVSNTGVIHVNALPSSGIAVTGNSDLLISCSGLLSLTSPPNSGVTVGAGLLPLVNNTGLLSLTASTGLINSSTAQTPNIANNGVIDISGSVIVTGFPNVKLSTVHPSISLIGTLVNSVMNPNPINGLTNGDIPISQIPGSIWATSIATQTPYSSGTFTINVSLSFFLAAFALNMGSTTYTIYDSINNVAYPAVSLQNAFSINRSQVPNQIYFFVLKINIDLATLWASGFRVMTHIRMRQFATTDPSGQQITFLHKSENTNVFATYSTAVAAIP